MQPELEIELVRKDLAGIREDFTDLKDEVKQMRIAVQKLISIEDKLTADRESRSLLWSKYEMIDSRLRNVEGEVDCVKEHKKAFREHCEVVEWCKGHRHWFESTKNAVLLRIFLLALAGWGVVALLGYSVYKTFKG